MTTESADHCILVNELVWSSSQVSLLKLEVVLGSVLESELGEEWICRCVKGMYRLKLVSSENNSGFN